MRYVDDPKERLVIYLMRAPMILVCAATCRETDPIGASADQGTAMTATLARRPALEPIADTVAKSLAGPFAATPRPAPTAANEPAPVLDRPARPLGLEAPPAASRRPGSPGRSTAPTWRRASSTSSGRRSTATSDRPRARRRTTAGRSRPRRARRARAAACRPGATPVDAPREMSPIIAVFSPTGGHAWPAGGVPGAPGPGVRRGYPRHAEARHGGPAADAVRARATLICSTLE